MVERINQNKWTTAVGGFEMLTARKEKWISMTSRRGGTARLDSEEVTRKGDEKEEGQ